MGLLKEETFHERPLVPIKKCFYFKLLISFVLKSHFHFLPGVERQVCAISCCLQYIWYAHFSKRDPMWTVDKPEHPTAFSDTRDSKLLMIYNLCIK